MLIALGLKKFAGLRQPGNLLDESIVAEVIDEERGGGHEGAREPSAGHIHVVRSVLHVEAGEREMGE